MSSLRVMAVAAPELPEGGLGDGVLQSRDPASLYNACRVAASRADLGVGAWGDSNWCGGRARRRETVLLMHSWDEAPLLAAALERERPNLLLIGAMSICFPGAVACATLARDLLGDSVCIVLGGRHAGETCYIAPTGVVHHPGSPVRLMAEGIVAPVFDLVVAGEAEALIPALGEAVAGPAGPRSGAAVVRRLAESEHPAGRWILGWLDGTEARTLVGRGGPLNRNTFPAPAEMFGVTTSFDVFGGRLTAHAFSDTGSGCVLDCEFCSERRSVTGGLVQIDTAADRLARQFERIVDVVATDAPESRASAFVEDSTLLGGSTSALRRLADLLRRASLDLRFGAQFTVDQILSKGDAIGDLKDVGLDYIFIGLETPDPGQIGGMSKDLRARTTSWRDRSEQVIEQLTERGIQCGGAVLFGLGESHAARLEYLHMLAGWRGRYGGPDPVSLNWAVQHPLQGHDGGTGYRYVDWAVPAGPWLSAFRDFGEASTCYPLAGQQPPVLHEVEEIAATADDLFRAPPVTELAVS